MRIHARAQPRVSPHRFATAAARLGIGMLLCLGPGPTPLAQAQTLGEGVVPSHERGNLQHLLPEAPTQSSGIRSVASRARHAQRSPMAVPPGSQARKWGRSG